MMIIEYWARQAHDVYVQCLQYTAHDRCPLCCLRPCIVKGCTEERSFGFTQFEHVPGTSVADD